MVQFLGSIIIQYSGIQYTTNLNRIDLEENEHSRYFLEEGDILFIRVNGNPDYVGRSAVFEGYSEAVYHNDHLIRIQINSEKYLPKFLVYCFNSTWGKQIIRSQVKTSAGQHTISQGGIEELEWYLPDIQLQEKFVLIFDKIQILKNRLINHKDNDLFQSLSQQFFNPT